MEAMSCVNTQNNTSLKHMVVEIACPYIFSTLTMLPEQEKLPYIRKPG
jgi:hypothetical protein